MVKKVTNNKKPMSKNTMLKTLADNTGMSKKEVVGVIDELMALAYREAPKGFTFPGLGKLLLKDRKKRKGRNPRTGESIIIPAKKVVKFRLAKAAKEAILPSK